MKENCIFYVLCLRNRVLNTVRLRNRLNHMQNVWFSQYFNDRKRFQTKENSEIT